MKFMKFWYPFFWFTMYNVLVRYDLTKFYKYHFHIMYILACRVFIHVMH